MRQPRLELTAVLRKVPEAMSASPWSCPAPTRRALAEARVNLREAIQLVLEANRALAEQDLVGQEVIREPIRAPAG